MVKINTRKFASVRTKFASNIDGLGKGITKLTAMDGSVTPDQVSEVLTEEVLPAVEGIKNVIAQIDDALPTTEEEGGLGEGLGNGGGEGGNGESEEEETGVLSAMDDEDEEEVHTASDAEDAALQKRLQHVEASLKDTTQKLASVLSENTSMKKAKLAKLYASNFPVHMRQAMEDEFLKENEDEEIDAMEAKVASSSKVFESYKTAGLLKKASMPSESLRTAKNDKTNGGAEEAVPWYMR